MKNDDQFDHLVTGFTDDEISKLMGDATPPSFKPGTADEQGRLDQKQPVTCPYCDKEFVPG